MKKEENYGIFSAMEFASYIKYKFNELKPNIQNISPLKLQKSLYFCFAYWGAFAYNGNNSKNEISDQRFDEYLFNDEIEAWVYGPVVPTVYRNSDKIEICNPEEMFKGKEYVRDFIDGVLEDVLNASDFRLVNISHEDQCWKKHFHQEEDFHEEEIPKEEIIKEYVNQI